MKTLILSASETSEKRKSLGDRNENIICCVLAKRRESGNLLGTAVKTPIFECQRNVGKTESNENVFLSASETLEKRKSCGDRCENVNLECQRNVGKNGNLLGTAIETLI